LHRCVKFHDTEYAVYGDTPAVGDCPENADAKEDDDAAGDEEGDRGDDDTVGSVIAETQLPPTEAARGAGRGRVRRPVSSGPDMK